LLGGRLADRYGRKIVAVGAQLLAASVYIPCGLLTRGGFSAGNIAATLVPLLVLVNVIFDGFADPARMAMHTDLTTTENRQAAFSLNYLGHNLGFAIGPLIAGFLFNAAPEWLFWGNAIAVAVATTLVALFVPETKPTEQAIQASLGTTRDPEAELPVLLPYLEGFQPDGSGLSPLARCESFAATACPRCRGAARRETDVSDNFLDSAWYFLRYPSSDFPGRPFDPERTRRWLPVARYVGGNEHAVLHLLYTRFVTMALHDMGWLAFEEPFVTFRAHGLLVKDGAKMSKSRGNVVNPDAYLERYGADVLRTYLMFAGDFQASGDFRDGNITGIERFIARVWRLAGRSVAEESAPDPDLEAAVREKVRRVTADIERLHYNTAIAACMELLSEIDSRSVPSHRHVAVLLRLLEPFAPFVTHELWERIGGQGMLCAQPWPHAEEDARELVPCRDVSVAIQVDGKLRDTMPLRAGTPEEEAVHAALARDRVRRHVVGRRVARSVYVQDRILNIVTTSAP